MIQYLRKRENSTKSFSEKTQNTKQSLPTSEPSQRKMLYLTVRIQSRDQHAVPPLQTIRKRLMFRRLKKASSRTRLRTKWSHHRFRNRVPCLTSSLIICFLKRSWLNASKFQPLIASLQIMFPDWSAARPWINWTTAFSMSIKRCRAQSNCRRLMKRLSSRREASTRANCHIFPRKQP